jgi:hypothetical protein
MDNPPIPAPLSPVVVPLGLHNEEEEGGADVTTGRTS